MENLTTYNPLINDTLTVQHSDYTGRIELPNNDANGLYKHLVADAANTRPLNKVVSTLESSPLNLTQTKDFEKVRARKLRKDIDYTFSPTTGLYFRQCWLKTRSGIYCIIPLPI
jgi:hypothetical protein